MRTDIVNDARNVVQSLQRKNNKPELTTSQIRKFLAAVNAIENRFRVWQNRMLREGNDPVTLPPDLANEIKFLKVKLAYQAGRERNRQGPVNDFLEKSRVLERIDAIGNDSAKFREFARWVEAIAAYHKYEGGQD